MMEMNTVAAPIIDEMNRVFNAIEDGTVLQNGDVYDSTNEYTIREAIWQVARQFGFETLEWAEDAGWTFRHEETGELVFGWTETYPAVGFDDQVGDWD